MKERIFAHKVSSVDLLLSVIILLCSLIFVFQLRKFISGILLFVIIVAILILVGLLIFGAFKISKITLAIELLLCVCLIFVGIGISKLKTFTNKVTSTNEVETVQIVALKDSTITEESDFTKLSLAYLQDDLDSYKKGAEILNEHDKTVSGEEPYKTAEEAYKDLKDKKVDLMVLTNMTKSELSNVDENYADNLKVIYSKDYDMESAVVKAVDITKEPFTIYIQGADLSSGDNINATGRGDVNILLTVNPNTKKVNLQVVPRDLFVYIPCKDASSKLSYSGWMGGIQSSISSIEQALGIEINYYAKLNFTGLTELVDALGGVKVYSLYTYTAGEYNFVEGYNDVDGKKALMFARARKMLPLNERSRGYQQMELIKGIFTKFAQEPTLTHALSVIDSLENNFTTNIPEEDFVDVYQLVKEMLPQLQTMESHSIEGELEWHMDEIFTSDYLYYFYPAEGEIDAARARINDVLEGK